MVLKRANSGLLSSVFYNFVFVEVNSFFFRTVDNRYGGLTTSYPENVNSYEPYLPCYSIRTGYLQKNSPDMQKEPGVGNILFSPAFFLFKKLRNI